VEALAFFDGDGDVDGLAVGAAQDKGNTQAIIACVNVIGDGSPTVAL